MGTWLATRGAFVAIGLGLAVASTAVLVLQGLAKPRLHGGSRGGEPSDAALLLPILASYVLAWGAGVMVAFGGALEALRRDVREGIVTLARTRGVTTVAYARGRVGGLVLLLAACVGGGTLIVGLAELAAGEPAVPTARATLGAVLYSLAFAITLGPVALATLGARSRGPGYLLFLLVVVLPELVSPWTSALLPRGWTELTSLPSALDAIAATVSAGRGGLRFARAVALLGAVVGASLLAVGTQISRLAAAAQAASSADASPERGATRHA